jgi:hypothetical protein
MNGETKEGIAGTTVRHGIMEVTEHEDMGSRNESNLHFSLARFFLYALVDAVSVSRKDQELQPRCLHPTKCFFALLTL